MENVGKCCKMVQLKVTYNRVSSKNWWSDGKLTESSVGVSLFSSVAVCSTSAEFEVEMICKAVGNAH